MKSAVVAIVAMSLAGCAHELGGLGSAQHAGLRAGVATGVQVALYDNGLYGPNVAVQRSQAGYRGSLMNRVVDLSWSRTGVNGMVDSAPTSLRWTEEGDGYRIRGLYGGSISNLRVTSDAIEGNIGGCSYQLRAAGAGYRGRAMCLGGFDQDAELALPADLGARSEGEQVALISLLLTANSPNQLDQARTAEAPSPGVDYFWIGGDPVQGRGPRW